ncbi:MAG TPA: hypothetical protein VEX86_13650 [Longimicrobium sp.]|nr:hypothetical protein [Longimicrobium sp.]
MERTHLWTKLADTTRPLTSAPADRRTTLDEVVRTVDAGRAAGLDGHEISHVRGLALTALSSGERGVMVKAIARIYGTALLERAKAHEMTRPYGQA